MPRGHPHYPMTGIRRREQRGIRLAADQGADLRAMHMKARRAIQPLRVCVQERVQQLQQNQYPAQQGDAFGLGHDGSVSEIRRQSKQD